MWVKILGLIYCKTIMEGTASIVLDHFPVNLKGTLVNDYLFLFKAFAIPASFT